ncbi:MAG TPA: restriction endonuclease subunit S [Flavobacteriaceae bacterium]|nr:restriction endonuclease subunit S [Flavobacteriaceae bacterium]|tara:strand:+ start:208 stop:1407 length:1200 start_codon:yes stop_codon:yes gene_type:complete
MDKQLKPQLRFPEFTSSWEKKYIKSIANVVGGGTPSTTNDEYWNGEINWFTPTEIKFNVVSESNRKITELGLNNSSATILPKGTILLTTRATIGEVAIAQEECTTNQGFQSLIVNKSNSNQFVFDLIKVYRNELYKRANGSTFKEISKKEIEKIKVLIPQLPEQQKIASFLTDVDDKITKLTKKKDLLEQYKKGIMQKIFNQELRFKDDNGNEFPKWEEKKLGSICNYKNGGSFEQYVSNEGVYNLISLNSLDINGKLKPSHKKVTINDNSLDKGDLVMVLSDVAHGYFLGLTDIVPDNTFVLNQRMGALKPKININSYFLKTYINFNQKYFKLMGQGSSQQNLSKGDILKFTVKTPIIEEQIKIANFLSDIDIKIEVLNTKIENSKAFKKGLLQQMFV